MSAPAKPAPRILAHAIGGGWDYRHAGCAAKCCEVKAEPVQPRWTTVRAPVCGVSDCPTIISRGEVVCDSHGCSGCEAMLNGPPAPMDFDRDAVCESCQAEDPPCGRGAACEGIGVCADCSGETTP